jgi:hypothetical protein
LVMIGFIGMQIGKWSSMCGMRGCMIGRQLKSEDRDLNSDDTDMIIRLFFGDVGHCFIDFLENEFDLFHDPVIKRLHQFINGFITGVVHLDFFRVPFDFLENIATDVGVAVF